MYGSSERSITFKHPIPVYITYQTAFTDDAGKPQARADIYGLDRDLLNDPARRPPQRRHADRAQLQLEQQAGGVAARRHRGAASELRQRNDGYATGPATRPGTPTRHRDRELRSAFRPVGSQQIW